MAEKKKILYIVEAMGGGVFTYIVDLANELVNSYDMYIAYAVRKQTPQNYKDYFDKRIHLIEVKNFGRVIDPLKDVAAFFEVKKIAAEIKPDVIHLHSSKAGAIGRMAFDGKIPMFYTPHGYSFLMEDYKPMKRRMFKLIESVCAKRNCTTISCSVGEHQESLKLTKHATYVNNGINMAELQKIVDKTEKVEHPFTVYTLGRICYQKNPTLFNEIAESLPDVKFVWIGDGELRGELTSKNIEITGWADRSTAIRYAVNADAFLLPSRWEGLPISLLESMYMKKICVVSNVIGNNGKEFIGITPNWAESPSIAKRYELHWFFQDKIGKKKNILWVLSRIITKIEMMFRYKRYKNEKIHFYGGPEWFSITGKAATYILNHGEWAKNRFKETICSDEIFVQTIIGNSAFAENIYNKESGDSYAECLRYARFNGPLPFVLNIGDYNVLVNSNCIFARKFGTSLPEEKELVDKIFDMYK